MYQEPVEKIKFTEEDDISEFHYAEDTLFDRPLVIRGTRKQYVPYPAIKKMQVLEGETLSKVVESLQIAENFLQIPLSSVAELTPILIKDTGFLFRVGEPVVGGLVFRNVFVPFQDENNIAFKRLSTILGIPYNFSKKNPAFLNEQTFSVWKDKICELKNKEIPVTLIVNKSQTVEVEHEGVTIVCDTLSTIHVLQSVKKVDSSTCAINQDIADQIPVLHQLTPLFVDTVKEFLPQDTEIMLHSVATAFNGANKGDHFIKLLLKHPELNWDVGGSEYYTSLSLRSHFTGEDKKSVGLVTFNIGVVKLACSNGMTLELPEEHLITLRDVFVRQLLAVNNITEANPKYDKYLLRYTQMFKKRYSGFGCTMPLHEAMTALRNSDFVKILKIFLSCKTDLLTNAITKLQEPFPVVSDEDFVEVIENITKKCKLAPDIAKSVILEYLSWKQDGINAFRNPYDIVNYVTFFAQTYNSRMQENVEKKVFAFGEGIAHAFKNKANYRQEMLSKYQNMLTA